MNSIRRESAILLKEPPTISRIHWEGSSRRFRERLTFRCAARPACSTI